MSIPNYEEEIIALKTAMIQLAMKAEATKRDDVAKLLFNTAADLEAMIAGGMHNARRDRWFVHAVSAISCWMYDHNYAAIDKFIESFPERSREILSRERRKAYEAYLQRGQA
jgi:predicted N-acyltransferase